MRLTFLGTGTSFGVPQIGCDCAVCSSTDPRDKRTRSGAILEAAGVHDVLTKSLGSANPHNVIKATFDALIQLRNKAEVAALRGKAVEEL